MKQLLMGLLLVCSWASAFGPYDIDIIEVKDGDTALVMAHLWPGLSQRVSVRIDGINTPEKRTRLACEKQAGYAATDYAVAWVASAKSCRLVGVGLGKFAGRVLGDIECDGELWSAKMLSAGHARAYHGGARGAWCEDP